MHVAGADNCSFPAMIDDWRSKFHLANAQMDAEFPFGFVQVHARVFVKQMKITGSVLVAPPPPPP
jgi:hypothetical protein